MATVQTKSIVQSKTLWGGVILLITFALQTWGKIEINAAEGENIVEAAGAGDWATLAGAIVGFITLVVGRIKAKTPVSLTGGIKPAAMLLLLVLPTFLLTGCTNPKHDALAVAADMYLESIGTEYLEYVDADEAKTVDEKALRHTFHNTFREAVDSAQAATAP